MISLVARAPTELYVFTEKADTCALSTPLAAPRRCPNYVRRRRYVVSITDGDGNVTAIQRTGGAPTAIVAPAASERHWRRAQMAGFPALPIPPVNRAG
jgi:hypothetical protein